MLERRLQKCEPTWGGPDLFAEKWASFPRLRRSRNPGWTASTRPVRERLKINPVRSRPGNLQSEVSVVLNCPAQRKDEFDQSPFPFRQWPNCWRRP